MDAVLHFLSGEFGEESLTSSQHSAVSTQPSAKENNRAGIERFGERVRNGRYRQEN